MKTRVGIGDSNHNDPFTAGREAARLAWHQINTGSIALCMLFASSRYDNHYPSIIAGAKSLIGDVPLIGCTTAGEITPNGPHRRSVVVLLIKRSEHITVSTGSSIGLDQHSRQAGHELARISRTAYEQAEGSSARQLLLLLSDGLRGNGADVLRGIQEILGTSFPIAGGSAGDDQSFTQTYQFHNDQIITDGAVGALFGGTLVAGIGSRHGWKPLGKPHIVTGVRANTITTIDHQPAVTMYESYFGTDAKDLESHTVGNLTALYPVGISINSSSPEDYLVRSPFRILDDGALLCNAETPAEAEIHLMMATRDTVIEAAREAAQEAREQIGGAKAFCAIILESTARQQLLGLRTADELRSIREIVGTDVPTVGFYTYGEQSPLTHNRASGQVGFQNQSIVIILLGEP